MGDTRPTVELVAPLKVPSLVPKLAAKPATTHYSVRRASTENERSQLVERVAVRPREPKWRVEISGERVLLRTEGVEIELSQDEARRIAETILRR